MKVLGIETSCDETAVCLAEANGEFGPSFEFNILGNELYSQIAIHAPYGGVFPNLAKREHARNLVPLLIETLRQASALVPVTDADGHHLQVNGAHLQTLLAREPELFEQLSDFLANYNKPDIDVIAVTAGPGLEPALWVGVNFAKALSTIWNIPVVAVNHMEGHIMVSMMEHDRLATFEFPVLALLISGGHTELVLSKQFGTYELVGQTRDDAAGEAFDKVARLLDLPYPGGPEISRIAAEARNNREMTSHACRLPRPMINEDNFDFSFSGLKTAVRRMVEGKTLSGREKSGIAREFEDAVTEVLVAKTLRAADAYGVNTVVVGGGVSANRHIREELARKLEDCGSDLLLPAPELATDNAIMIALTGYFHALNREFADAPFLLASGNLRLGKEA